uniref:GST N-terminal domain-containing protein n=1 Tax=Pundamilia nyererei TaxID=303518 RepID=A0A3B4FEG6_9CICH
MPMTLNHWDICRPAQPICILLEYTGEEHEDKQWHTDAFILQILHDAVCSLHSKTENKDVEDGRVVGNVSPLAFMLKIRVFINQ